MPAAASIEPTERSIPEVAITNVIPTATTPTTLAWVRIARKLSTEAKLPPSRIAPTRIRIAITPTSAYSWVRRRPDPRLGMDTRELVIRPPGRSRLGIRPGPTP